MAGGAISDLRQASAEPTGWSRFDPRRPELALGLVLTILTFVPNVVAPPRLLWMVTGASLAVLLTSFWKYQQQLRWSIPISFVAVYVSVSTLSVVHHGTLMTVAQSVAWGALALVVVVLAASLDASARTRLVVVVLCLSGVQLLVATGSTFAGLSAPWGYLGRSGTVFRENPLVSALPGRATGTMAHPIPFGAVMAVAALLSMFGLHHRGWVLRGLLTGVFLGGVALSGTRSAAIGFVVAVVFALFAPRTVRHPIALRSLAVLAAAAVVSLVRVDDLPIFTSLQGTGSVSHRAAALDAGLRLLDRPLIESMAGSGFGSIPELFDLGYLQLDGFTAVDNQLVASLATTGIIGLICVIGLVLYCTVAGDRSTRPATVFMFLMFLSFDVLQWYSATVLFFVLIALGTNRDRTPAPRSSLDPTIAGSFGSR